MEQGYYLEVTVHQFLDGVITLAKDFSDLTLFWDNSSLYCFHPSGLKHGGQLDNEVMECILF